MSTDAFGHPSTKRPTARVLDVDNNASTVNVCDDRNFVSVINIEKYFDHFPCNMSYKQTVMDDVIEMEMETADKSQELEQNLCGDAFWRSEITAISAKLDDDDSGAVYHLIGKLSADVFV